MIKDSPFTPFATRALIAGSILIALLFLFWLFCLNHVSITNIGVAYNSFTGDITVQRTPGWYVTSPFVRVVDLSTLPMRVTIPSDATIINSKIVRFNPDGAIDFVKRQGFSYTLGTQQETVMLGYAFSGKPFTFLDILEESATEPARH